MQSSDMLVHGICQPQGAMPRPNAPQGAGGTQTATPVQSSKGESSETGGLLSGLSGGL